MIHYVEVSVKRGKSRKSALWLMIAMLITCVLSSAVLGENPWDSDKRPKQSSTPGSGTDSTIVTTIDSTRPPVISSSANPSSRSGWTGTVNRVVYYFARNYARWLKPSVPTRSASSDRW